MEGLFERLVSAVEIIAANMSPAAARNCNGGGPVTTNTVEVKTEATKYPDEKDRDAWLFLCKDRDIEVPVRTKTPTLVKMVKAWDAAHPEGVVPPKAKFKTVTKEPDVLEETEEDPFADDSVEEKKYTLDETRAHLQLFLDKYGKDATFALLAKFDVKKLPLLPPEKYGALMKAADEWKGA